MVWERARARKEDDRARRRSFPHFFAENVEQSEVGQRAVGKQGRESRERESRTKREALMIPFSSLPFQPEG